MAATLTGGNVSFTAGYSLTNIAKAGQGTASTVTVKAPTLSDSQTATMSFTFGTGSSQFNAVYSQDHTLAASASETIDLSTGLSDIFGATFGFATVKEIYVNLIANPDASTGASSITVGAAASNANLLWLGSATDTFTVYKSGIPMHMGDPTGKTVSGSAKNVKILNNDSSNKATFRITVVGVAV